MTDSSPQLNPAAENSFRFSVFDIIDNEVTSDWRSQAVDAIIMFLIILSLASTVAESFQYMRDNYDAYFDIFEDITLFLFSSEYILRVWTADFKYPNPEGNRWQSRWAFMTSGSGVIDFAAIFPLFMNLLVPTFFDMDLRFIRILKVTRMLRVLKLSSFTRSVMVVGDVFYEKRYELGVTLFTTFIVMLVASTMMYYVENDAPYNIQNGKFTNIVSTMWWSVATLTTVGYGDIYPVTPWGQFVGSIIAVLGLGIVALPTAIIGAAFIEKIEKQQEEMRVAQEAERLAQEKQMIEDAIEEAEQHRLNGTQPEDFATAAQHDKCMFKFGSEFIFCPYCGKKLQEHQPH